MSKKQPFEKTFILAPIPKKQIGDNEIFSPKNKQKQKKFNYFLII